MEGAARGRQAWREMGHVPVGDEEAAAAAVEEDKESFRCKCGKGCSSSSVQLDRKESMTLFVCTCFKHQSRNPLLMSL